MKVIFEPVLEYREQIANWLLDEKVKKISNFYYNFINADFTNNNFACLINDHNEAIGYIYYSFFENYSIINVAIIKHEFKKKGYGKLLLEELSKNLVKRGTLVLKLFCEPSSSKTIWKKLGFKEFKEIENHRHLNSNNFKHPWLFKTLVPTLKATKKKTIDNKIELWTDLEYTIKDQKPNYVWDITVFDLPIIYPCDDEWKIKLIVNNQTKYEGVIKRFGGGVFNLGDFLIIDKKN